MVGLPHPSSLLADAVELLSWGRIGVDALLAEEVVGDAAGVAAQDDVRTATGHVGSDGDAAEASGLGDDLALSLVVLGVQHLRHL